jgi:methionyl aminopeptidase
LIPIKSPQEIEMMKEGGKIAAEVLAQTLAAVEQGVSTLELNNLAEHLILSAGGKPSFKGFQDYPFATCININEGIVHGLPTERKIKEGDVVTVDLGVLYKGLHTDNARTVKVQSAKSGQAGEPVGSSKVQNSLDKFLGTGQLALEEAIKQCQVGKTVGDISHAIQTTVEGAGYNVTRELGGHGVGRELHEPPFIPGFGSPKTGPVLKEGMTLAIEVIYTAGSGKMRTLDDDWTVVTADGRLAGLFEHSIAITATGPIILTLLR